MKREKSYIICIVLQFLVQLVAGGQTGDIFPKLYPSSVTVYDIDRGLPISCMANLFADSRGRLFINPCSYQDIYQNLSFYQFDGNKSQPVQLELPEGEAGPFNWYLEGITEEGLLFGMDSEDTYAFLYDPDSGEKHIFPFGSAGQIRAMISGPGREVFVLTNSQGVYSLYSLRPEGEKMLTQIPVAEDAFFGRRLPAIRSGDQIWFPHLNKGFFLYSLTNNLLKQYDWLDLTGDLFTEYPVFSNEWTNIDMTFTPGGEILFYIRAFGGFFVFDPAAEQLNRQLQLDAYLKQIKRSTQVNIRFFRDFTGNLLVDLSWPLDPGVNPNADPDLTAAVLWGHDGQFFDYQPIVKTLSSGRYQLINYGFYLSRNFKKQALIATVGGMIVVDLKASLSIRSGLDGWASRAIGMIDKDRVLVLSENGNKALLDLRTMTSTILRARESDHPLFASRNFGQLVSTDDQLWFPTEGAQLACYRSTDQSFRYYEIGQLFDKFTFIQPREIAFANTQNEIFRYDLDKGSLRPFLKDGAPLQIGGTVNEMILDKSGVLWIASLNGLWRIDPRTDAIKRLGKTDGLASDHFLCIYETEGGELLLGTLGSGLQFYDPKTGTMNILDQSTGLSNNTVAGILGDDQGDFWVSTFDGLTAVSKEGNVLFKLSEKEGLPHREFNRYSYLKVSNGRLLFGGVVGVTMLDPKQIKAAYSQQDSLKIYLTEVRYYDKSRKMETLLAGNFGRQKRIVLPATHRYIKLDFSLSDFSNPDKSLFAYRFHYGDSGRPEDDMDAIWTDIGTRSELFLSDLPAGSYTLLVKGTNSKGQVTESPLAVSVHVREFFYKEWWFYVLCSMPFLLGAYFWILRLQTERERLEAEVAARTQQILRDKTLIEEQAARLQTLDDLKSRFFTNISHEFRTPLTVISGMATQIRQQPGQWLEKGIELIQRNSQQLLSLINQILDLRKIESGAMKVDLVKGNIIPYLRYIAESFIQLAQSRGLRIHVLSSIEAVEMDYDPDKMMHILSNLLSNAIKFTPAPGDIYLQIDRKFSQTGRDLLSIQVRDTGKGVPKEALPFIFDRFYQVEDLASQKIHGSGIGLTLTKELIQLLNGTIEVSSEPGAGTTFILNFPISIEAGIKENRVMTEFASPVALITPTPLMTQEPIRPGVETVAGKPSLLLVEDNEDVRLYLTACLENHYQLLLAKDGREGIELAIEQVPDLIVSDVMMPVKNGFELCDTLKNDERTSHIPVVLLTAKADFESRMTGLRRGADAYLSKPFEQEELLVRLEQLLILRKKLQERYRELVATGGTSGTEDKEIEDVFIQKLRQEVLTHISEEGFGVLHLQRALGVSRTQLHNKVKALTGQSTTEFIRMIRLNKARELLQTTDLNVSEVGYEVGFGNPAYFSRIYAEAFGEAPRQTRK